jgi:anti-sigma regulatory factor (Ser/Thr protein kinase)
VGDPPPYPPPLAPPGHLAPLLRHADGTLAYLKGEQGLPIGVDPNAEYVEHRVDAPAGSTLLLFTDGLVERRDTRLDDMLDALAREVARAGVDIHETAEQLLHVGPPLDSSDDTALLIARRPGTARGRAAVTSTLQLAVLPLPCEPRAVGHARRWLVQRLHRWSAAQAVDVVELLASEIVTNAVVHATTDLLVRLEHLGDRVRVAVTDGRSTVPSRRDFATDAPGGRGMGLVDALADAWGVEVVERGKVVWFEVLLR